MNETPHGGGATYNREAAVRAILEREDSVLGRVYQYHRQGFTPAQMAEAEDNQTAAFVYNNKLQFEALVSGEVPNSIWVARAVASRLRTWLRTLDLDEQLRTDLTLFESVVRSRAEDPEAEAQEIGKAVANTDVAERKGVPGIYVYTLPHYLKHPVDTKTQKTLLKVGHSSKDALHRVESSGRLTALPEDPILLRVYPAEASGPREKDFHDWLKDADHHAGRTRRAGSEWFVTSTKFLDRVAKSLGLQVDVVNDVEVGED